MRVILWIGLFIASVLSTGALAQTSPITVTLDKQSQQLIVYNSSQAPYTLSFQFKLENARVNCTQPCRKVAPPGKQVSLLSFRRKGNGQWRYRYNYTYQLGDYRKQHQAKTLYRLPFKLGKTVKVSQGYQGSFSHQNTYALDFPLPLRTSIYAARAGKVVETEDQYSQAGLSPAFKDKANFILIEHIDGSFALYSHLDHRGVRVKIGEKVKAGTFLGYSGHTGYSSQPHLHFEVRSWGEKAIKTHPTLFKTHQGTLELKKGQSYTVIN